jgi:hypothetical protein
VLTVGGAGQRGSKISREAEMNDGGWQSSLARHAGRSVVGDGSSLGAFYRPEVGQEVDGGYSMRRLQG